MKCPKCGAELADNAKFCTGCGAKIEAPAPETKAEEVKAEETKEVAKEETKEEVKEEAKEEAPKAEEAKTEAPKAAAPAEKKDNGNMMKIIIAAAAAVVLLLFIIIVANIAGNNYKGGIKNYVKLLNSRSTDDQKLMSFDTPPLAMTYYNDNMAILKKMDSEYVSDYKEAFEDDLSDFYDYLDDTYDDDWKITVEFRGKEKMSKKDIKKANESFEDLAEYYEDYYDFDEDDFEDILDDADLDEDYAKQAYKAYEKFMKGLGKVKISKGYEVDVTFKIDGGDGDDKLKTTVYAYKMNGTWVYSIGGYATWLDPVDYTHSSRRKTEGYALLDLL